jgi:uncharacterized protein (TIGR03067 family)
MMRVVLQLLALTMTFALAFQSRAAEPKDDVATLQGEWGAEAYIDNGEDVFGEKVEAKESPVRWDFKKSKVYFLADVEEATVEIGYKLDSSAKPREIDFTFTSPDDPKQTQVMKGVYELRGDTMKVCYGTDGAERPKAFSSNEGSKRILAVFGKVKQ